MLALAAGFRASGDVKMTVGAERSPARAPSDTTMTSVGAIGSLTSAHPAARRTDPRTEGTATMAAATNVTTTPRIEAHLGRR
jgi:hypothetical protein